MVGPRRMLVTGAGGFIGTRMARIAAESGWQVFAMVRRLPLEPGLAQVVAGVRQADLSDPAALRSAVEQMDCVVHLAALTRARSEAEFMAANAGGVGRLLDAIRGASAPPGRLVYVSSLAAGGPSDGAPPIDEDVAPHPVSAYGRSKLAGEAELWKAPVGLRWSIVRPPIVYGPGERDLLQMFRLSQGLLIPVVGFAERWYSIVHADDLCRGILAVADAAAAASRTYYLANAAPISGLGLAQAVIRATRGRARTIRVPDLVAALLAAGGSLAKPFRRRPPLLTLDKYPEIVRSWVCSSARAAREVGFEAQIPLEVGLQSVAHWYREAGWLR